jgi:hypothetical protein
MLTLDDCIALSELTEAEIAAIAEHEHLPAIVAAELGSYLVHDPDGCPVLRRMIIDDIEAARQRGDIAHFLALKLVLKRFVEAHPNSRREPSAR